MAVGSGGPRIAVVLLRDLCFSCSYFVEDIHEAMGCQKGKPKKKPKPGDFRCKSCGAVSGKKKRLCKPKKISEKD